MTAKAIALAAILVLTACADARVPSGSESQPPTVASDKPSEAVSAIGLILGLALEAAGWYVALR